VLLARSIPNSWPKLALAPNINPPGVSLNRPEPKKQMQ
jgi:hypothetical protein